jgi:hypothetical protein
VLNLSYKNSESPQAAEEPWTNRSDFEIQLTKAQPSLLFTSQDEMNHIIQTFGNNLQFSHSAIHFVSNLTKNPILS